jgi:cell pole-organizing protein PopZ
MSKPQLASEPSMEEILSSIRKMISDDRPGPSPMPDQMGRTPFGESRSTSQVSEVNSRLNASPVSPAQPAAGQGSNFNSLADALKVATALSDQRRSLQQEIASVLEKGPRHADPLSEVQATSANLHALPESGAAQGDTSGPRLPNFPDWRNEQTPVPPEGKRELLSFDFGTVVPQREDRSGKSAAVAADAKPASPASAEPASKGDSQKPESKAEQPAEEPRVLPMRSMSGLNGSTAANVAPFPRPMREMPKPAAEATPSPVEPTAEKSAAEKIAKIEAPAAGTEPAPLAVAELPAAAKAEAGSAHTEALLDAVVDLVQQQPGALSVFTSGASFIGGVGAKKAVADAIAAASASVSADTADASSVPGAPPKMDRAAAELLRPMLRQWLADNMPRIVEDALRSELTDTTQGDGKDPAKS